MNIKPRLLLAAIILARLRPAASFEARWAFRHDVNFGFGFDFHVTFKA